MSGVSHWMSFDSGLHQHTVAQMLVAAPSVDGLRCRPPTSEAARSSRRRTPNENEILTNARCISESVALNVKGIARRPRAVDEVNLGVDPLQTFSMSISNFSAKSTFVFTPSIQGFEFKRYSIYC